MKDAYSMDADAEGLDASYQAMAQAYRNIYRRCGLPAVMVEADSGAIGGRDSHEFILPMPTGEDTILRCDGCGYAANLEKAQGVKPAQPVNPPPAPEGSGHTRRQDHRRAFRILGIFPKVRP